MTRMDADRNRRFMFDLRPSASSADGSHPTHSVQPCASRTAIIVARMSFQVCGFIITALGNMQPSQQMCRNVLVSLPVLVAEPEAGVVRDVELAVGVGRQAVAAGVVVRARAEDGGVVLGDVEVDRPGPEGVGQGLAGPRRASALSFQSKSVGEDAVLGGVLAEGVEERVGHVGLEADGLGLADPLEQVDHLPPGVHAAPADLALGGEPSRRGPGRSAPACLKVSAIFSWFPSGSFAQSPTPLAESIRTTP